MTSGSLDADAASLGPDQVAVTQRRLQQRPTSALLRAVMVGLLGLFLSVLTGRVIGVVVTLPFVVWAVLATVRRLARGEAAEGTAAPTQQASRLAIAEGDRARFRIRTAPGTLVAATWPPAAHLDCDPQRGSMLGAGSVDLSVRVRRWGRYEIGPAHLFVADAAGAFRGQRTIPPIQLKVTPDASVLNASHDVPRPIGVSGGHLSTRRGDGTALADVRPFQMGDRLHRINWRVTSRTGVMHTNATFTEQDTDVLIVTDTLADVVPPGGSTASSPSSLDLTIRATTAVARHYLSAGDRVAVHDLGRLIGDVRPGTGPRQLRMLTTTLSRASRTVEPNALARRLRVVRSGTLVVMCTPLLAPPAIAQIGDLLAQGADVIVIDTLPPRIGDPSVLDGRARRDPGVRRGNERFFEEAWVIRRLQRRHTVDELRQRGVPVTVWEGPNSLAPVLLTLSRAASAPRMRRS